MVCLNCGKNKARKHPVYGVLPCIKCTKKNRDVKIKETIELTTQEIKESRKQYRDDILQPYRGGQLSKEYIKKYGTKNIKATPEEIKNAQNVWTETDYYKPD